MLLNDLDLQIVKIDGLYKTVLGKTGFVVTFKVCNIHIQPDGRTEIKLMADFVQRVKNFMGTGIVTAVLDAGVFQHMIIFKNFGPHTEHRKSPYAKNQTYWSLIINYNRKRFPLQAKKVTQPSDPSYIVYGIAFVRRIGTFAKAYYKTAQSILKNNKGFVKIIHF